MNFNRRIFFYCPDYSPPSGGIKVIYRYVDLLNEAGIPATVLHAQKGFRVNWFENSTVVTSFAEVEKSTISLLVIPEICGPNLHRELVFRREGRFWNRVKQIPLIGRNVDLKFDVQGIPKLIFNQNAYLTFCYYPKLPTGAELPYFSPDVLGTLCISQDNYECLNKLFPGKPLARLWNSVDERVFSYSRNKRNVISYMPRKNYEHAVQVFYHLQLRNLLKDYEVIPIDGKNEHQVAQILSYSRFFLSFGYPEGCPLPPLEAMASGAVVIGYHGNGGREYFDSSWSFPVDYGDIIGFTDEVERAMHLQHSKAETVEAMGKLASDTILQRYSRENEKKRLVEYFRGLAIPSLAKAAA